MSRKRLALLSTVALLGLQNLAAANPLVVGSFVPSAPLPSTSARVEATAKLATHLGAALGEGGVGRVYARAWDYARAVKNGDVRLGLVDAAYLASVGGNVTVLAVATHQGSPTRAWQLVARSAKTVMQLRGGKLLCPDMGGREASFVEGVLFDGNLPRSHFATVEAAPDTASTLAALALGKADAAIVPVDVTLPAGVQSVLRLPSTPGPLLVVYGSMSAGEKATLTAAAVRYEGDAGLSGFAAATGREAGSVSSRFSPTVKRGPLLAPPSAVPMKDLAPVRQLVIPVRPLSDFVPPATAPAT